MMEFIVWLITCFLATFDIAFFYYKLTDAKKLFSVKFIVVYLICSIFLTLIYYYNISFLGVISYFLICPPLFSAINYKNYKLFLYYSFVIWLYALLLDLIAMAIVSVLHHFFAFNIYGFAFESTLSIIVFTMLFVLAFSSKIKKVTNDLYKKIFGIKYFDVSMILFTIFTVLVGVVIFLNLNHLKTSVLLTSVIIMMTIVFIILMRYRVNYIETEIFLKTLKDNNDFYIKMEDDNRIFRHNLNGKLMSIKSVSNDKAKSLLNELLKENNKNVNISDNMKVIPYGFNGIIYEKVYPFTDKINIKIDNEIFYDIFDVLTPRRYNVLVEKVVVALDNAIEATLNSKNKTLVINIFEENNNVIIEIQNTFSNSISLDDLGGIGYSTKGKRRGLGLFSSLRNNEALLCVKLINDLFVSKISAKKNKKVNND